MCNWGIDNMVERQHLYGKTLDFNHRCPDYVTSNVALRQNAHTAATQRRNANVGATSAADRDDAYQCRRWANVTKLAGVPYTTPDRKLRWPYVGPTLILSTPRWANVDPTCLAIWYLSFLPCVTSKLYASKMFWVPLKHDQNKFWIAQLIIRWRYSVEWYL